MHHLFALCLIALCSISLPETSRAHAERHEFNLGVVAEGEMNHDTAPSMWRGAVAQPTWNRETRSGIRMEWGLTHHLTVTASGTLSLNPRMYATQSVRADRSKRELQLHHRQLLVPVGFSWAAARLGTFFLIVRVEGGMGLHKYTLVQIRSKRESQSVDLQKSFSGGGQARTEREFLIRVGVPLLWRGYDAFSVEIVPYVGMQGRGKWQAGMALELMAILTPLI